VAASDFEKRILEAAGRILPSLRADGETDQALLAMDIFGLAFAVPAFAAGAVWLGLSTDPAVVLERWPALVLLTVFSVVLSSLELRFYVRLGENLLGEFGGALDHVLVWAAALTFGPTGLWIWLPGRFVAARREYAEVPGRAVRRLRMSRSILLDAASTFISGLVALELYRVWGGAVPPSGLAGPEVLAAFGATVVLAVLSMLFNAPLFIYSVLSPSFPFRGPSRRVFLRFWATSSSWPLFVLPFGVFAAATVADGGVPVALFLGAATLLVAVGGHWASNTARESMERSRELSRLQRLAGALLEQPPGEMDLSGLLEDHAATMFTFSSIEIRQFPDRRLATRLRGLDPLPDAAWEWASGADAPAFFPPGSELPWGGTTREEALAMIPIIGPRDEKTLGAVALRRQVAAERLRNAVPAADSLGSLIAAALQRAEAYELALDHQRVEQELAVAADIQTSFMPRRAPEIEGWEAAGRIVSAREASGDFVDFVDLGEGSWGVLVADVSGKGIPAAIYMALARTVIRTYAHQESASPAAVLRAANRRILDDTDDDFFVTVFYGVLNAGSGCLTYASAGHDPAVLLRPNGPELLESTGVPLGLLPDVSWSERSVTVAPGETVSVHTDGVTDARNEDGEFFSAARLHESLARHAGENARALVASVIESVERFVGETPRTDDMTLLVLKRTFDGRSNGG